LDTKHNVNLKSKRVLDNKLSILKCICYYLFKTIYKKPVFGFHLKMLITFYFLIMFNQLYQTELRSEFIIIFKIIVQLLNTRSHDLY